MMPKEAIMKYSDMNNDGEMDADFEKKMRIADLQLRDRDMKVKEEQAKQTQAADAEAELIRQLTAQSQGDSNA